MSKGYTHAQTPQLPDAVARLSGLLQRQEPLRDATRSPAPAGGTPRRPPPREQLLAGSLGQHCTCLRSLHRSS
uniref:Uncharacterized protein n=1 Tax=Moschus moschiferus TaxID=68415 RepID=A0A8C6DUU3_MOSMO